mmetsp:Transcript_5689/g.19158  ORF Transcript_5689/g.19158 Transcript_5689/m.19158 type:complete len:223 (-) Transcript_5689:1127-1795(-)
MLSVGKSTSDLNAFAALNASVSAPPRRRELLTAVSTSPHSFAMRIFPPCANSRTSDAWFKNDVKIRSPNARRAENNGPRMVPDVVKAACDSAMCAKVDVTATMAALPVFSSDDAACICANRASHQSPTASNNGFVALTTEDATCSSPASRALRGVGANDGSTLDSKPCTRDSCSAICAFACCDGVASSVRFAASAERNTARFARSAKVFNAVLAFVHAVPSR